MTTFLLTGAPLAPILHPSFAMTSHTQVQTTPSGAPVACGVFVFGYYWYFMRSRESDAGVV